MTIFNGYLKKDPQRLIIPQTLLREVLQLFAGAGAAPVAADGSAAIGSTGSSANASMPSPAAVSVPSIGSTGSPASASMPPTITVPVPSASVGPVAPAAIESVSARGRMDRLRPMRLSRLHPRPLDRPHRKRTDRLDPGRSGLGAPMGTAPIPALPPKKGEAVALTTEIAEPKPADVVAEVQEKRD